MADHRIMLQRIYRRELRGGRNRCWVRFCGLQRIYRRELRGLKYMQ